MSATRDFKRLVRLRMEQTGESYTAARAVLLQKAERAQQPQERATMTPPNTQNSEARSGIAEHSQPREMAKAYLEECVRRFDQITAEEQIELPAHGALEVALVLNGAVPPHEADRGFLDLIDRANPKYTGWPAWIVSSSFQLPQHRPHVFDETWEEVIIGGFSDHVDFLKFDPKGRFFFRRAHQEDFQDERTQIKPLTVLDAAIPVMRVAEAIAVGLAMAEAIGCNAEKTTLDFAFRWTRLRGRQLTALQRQNLHIIPGKEAYQDVLLSTVDVPMATPRKPAELVPYVEQVIRRLHRVFDGFVMDRHDIGEFVRYILKDPQR